TAISDPSPSTDTLVEMGDVGDSTAAVDDELWRQLDLAEEYHAMGVIANREGSWEEAQYYFEQGLTILASLDIEGDSLETPEAAAYSILLDDVIADYRVTLLSLGDLQGDVSPAVLIERFGDLANNLSNDSMLVFTTEPEEITFDIPVYMNERVRKSVVYFQTVAREAFEKFLRRSKKYDRMMKDIIRQYEMPEDLVYLSMVESGFNPRAYSWARASGLWQFIASTGRLYGLDRDWWIDERRDPIKSTHAACRFLKDLYQKFGSWELAMAAYNGGPGRVERTIAKQGTRDFWKLNLRRQTMDYVPLIMAAAMISKEPEKYGFESIEFEDELTWDEVSIDRCLDLTVVADAVGCTVGELEDLNPELLRKFTPPNVKDYRLKIPSGSRTKFLAAYESMESPKESSWVRHTIRRGETVSSIASRYGVSQYSILAANNMSSRSKIYAGRTLIVPVPLDGAPSGGGDGRSYESRNGVYVVRSGDTMWDIAKAFGTSVDALRRSNAIGRGARIYVGQKLRIPGGSHPADAGRTYAGTPAASKKSSGSSQRYTVRSGDTLWEIARKFGTTTSNIRRLNNLGRSSRIYPGQVLTVGGGSGAAADYVIHRVRRGESLSQIAQKYRTTIAKIIETNALSNPDQLQVGDQLRIYTE
ncbi:MAG TPA: LysM peptidoglycan-binding domain-containing protein, partial [candidate division Zixibacteria bacterium]|nr:LysM peptidoglycan-binding domain-containing protein [candidate division Zixibacteria bacterium]